MTLPFWPFSKLRQLEADAEQSDLQCGIALAEIARLRTYLTALHAKVQAQGEAQTLVQALGASTSVLSATISCLKDEIVKAIDTSGSKVAHATGAVATAQDKASNVQREWLEVSRGNR